MTDTDAQPAAPSAASDLQSTLDALPAKDYQAWRLTGKLDTPSDTSPSDAPAASSPDQPAEQAASTEALPQPDSDPGEKPKGKGAKARSAELDAEIQTLHEKLRIRAELRQQLADQPSRDVSAASSPATKVQPASVPIDLTTAPLTEEAFFAQFPEAPYSEHARYLGRYDRAQERATDVAAQTRADLEQRVMTVVDKGKAMYPEFEVKLAEASASGQQWPPAVSEYIFANPDEGVHIAHALLSDPTLSPRLARMTPVQIGLELSRVLPAGAPRSVPVLKTVSSAPPPPPALTSRAQAPVDEVEAALAAGDFRRFKAAETAREIAERRTGR